MKQRPERLVRVAFVEMFNGFRRNLDRDQPILNAPLVNDFLPLRVADFFRLAGPADPDATAALDYGIHRGGQAAGTLLGTPAGRSRTDLGRKTIGNDD